MLRSFSLDPNTDDIEEYNCDVCEAAKQLGHGNDTVLNLLKATMPTELYEPFFSKMESLHYSYFFMYFQILFI